MCAFGGRQEFTMRTLAFSAVLFTAALAAAPVLAQDGDGALTFRWTGLESAQGKVTVALFDSEAAFKESENPVRTAEVPAAAGAVEVNWTGLRPGRYAAVAYHDKDSNGKLNTLPIGLPTEPYGFSNDARGRFGAPAWKAAAFEVRTGENRQTARLR